jgi:nucleoside-diphosphate-sugar epimerase
VRVLVTGAEGFLGRHVVRALEAAGAVPIAGTHSADPSGGLECEQVSLSLEDRRSIDAALEKARPEAVINCAAYGVDHRQQDLETAVQVNVLGPTQLFAACRDAGVERFIAVGSAFEYGSHSQPITEAAPLKPIGLYGSSKAAGTTMLIERGRSLGSAPVIVRPFVMYGPGEQGHKLAPQVVRASKNGEELRLTRGHEIRDYIPVFDVARALTLLAGMENDRFPFGQVFNLCSGRPLSIRSFAEAVAEAAGSRASLQFGALPSRPDAPEFVVGDPTRWRSFCAVAGLDRACDETAMADVVRAMLTEDIECAS